MADKKTEEKVKLRRIIEGSVTNIIDDKTVKVRVERKYPHPKYGKIIKKHKAYIAHNTNTDINIGDIVTIGEVKPISKRKTWEIINKQESK